MPVIDNSNLIRMCNDCGAVGFVPVISFAFDPETSTFTFTNTSTIPAGTTFTKMKAKLIDHNGKQLNGAQTVQATPLAVDASTLDLSEPVNILIFISTANKINADGSFKWVSHTEGTVSHWDVEKGA